MLTPTATAAPVDRALELKGLGDDFGFEEEIDVDVVDGIYERKSVSTDP
jgi:hypothetical protein